MSTHKYSPPSSTSGVLNEKTGRSPAARTRRSSATTLVLIAVGAVVMLALALGLGLGLGLKHKHNSSSSNANSTTSGNATLPRVESQDSSAFVLRGPAMLSEPAQTRTFNFVLEERMGAPDGYEKMMLVVNGVFPGPTIEVNVGDTVVVNVTNLMPNAS